MKFVYRLQKKKIPILRSLSNVMSQITMGLNPMMNEENEFEEIVTGGYFYPDDGKTSINLTSEFLIRENKDKINANNVYLMSFFATDPLETTYTNMQSGNINNMVPDSNYIGKWSPNIDANANIYYVIVDNKIRKLIFSKPIEFGSQTDIFGVVYIIENDGKMVYCTPDEGDVLFDNIKEAKKYINSFSDISFASNVQNI